MKFPSFFSSQRVILTFIFLFALTIRIIGLSKNPAGFFCDEASTGYNAYTIWNQGKDEYGNPWPLFFKAFGEYKNPVFTYSIVPLVGIFGLSEFSVRLTSVIYGSLTIILIYFLTVKLFNQKTAFFSAFFLAISPWHIHFSRVALEGLTPMLFFLCMGTLFWLKYEKDKNLYMSILFFALALYSYFPARIFVPPFALFLILMRRKFFWKKKKLFFGLILWTLLLTAAMGKHVFLGPGMARWDQVKGNDLNLAKILVAYFNHFSITFLFKTGDIDFPGQFITRHSVRGMGELFWFQLPLLLAALIQFVNDLSKKINERRTTNECFVFLWLFLYPLGSIFTIVNPQATRSIIGIIPLTILSATGYVALDKYVKKIYPKLRLNLIFLVVLLLSLYRFNHLLKNYPEYSSDFWGWQYGPREITEYFVSESYNYDQLCMEGQFNAPEIFIKFYDPKNKCQNKCQICDISVYDPAKKQLFAISADSYHNLNSQKFQTKKIIYYPNNKVAFLIGEIKQL